MFLSKFLKNNKSKKILVLYIGSSVVAGSLVVFMGNKKNGDRTLCRVINSKIIPIDIHEEINFKEFLSSTNVSVKLIMEYFHSIISKFGKFDEISCFLGSTWYVSQTRTIKYKNNNSFIVTKELVDSLVQKEQANFMKIYIKDHSQFGSNSDLVEKKIINILVNGYETKNPYGKKINNMDIQLFISVSPSSVVLAIKESINKLFPHKNIMFHSQILALKTIVTDLFSKELDYLILDIGGEITDIAYIRDNIIVEMASFPLGRNFIIRRISKIKNKSLVEAKSILNMYFSDHLDKIHIEKLEKIINKARDEWINGLLDNFQKSHSNKIISKKIFLNQEDMFTNWIIEPLLNKKFEIIKINKTTLQGICVFENDTIPSGPVIIQSYLTKKTL